MAETTSNTDVVAPSDPKTEMAQQLLKSWCEAHACEPKDIASKLQSGYSRLGVAVLAYAMRRVVELDLFPTAEFMGIEPSEVAVLVRDMRYLIEDKKDRGQSERLDTLLVAARLREQKVKPKKVRATKPVHTPGLPGPERLESAEPKKPQELTDPKEAGPQLAKEERTRLVALTRRRRQQEAEGPLREARVEIAKRVCDITGFSYEFTFEKKSSVTDYLYARRIGYALIFILDERKNVASIARTFKSTDDAVRDSLRWVDRTLRFEGKYTGWWKEKIINACEAFDVKPERLMRKPD